MSTASKVPAKRAAAAKSGSTASTAAGLPSEGAPPVAAAAMAEVVKTQTEGAAEGEAKKPRVVTEEEKRVHNSQTTLARLAGGKVAKATEQQVQDAKQGLEVYKTLSKDDRLEFAKKVEQSKTNKDFSWTRTFVETLRAQKRVSEGVVENYYTRTLA